uniref:Uncharacterized protein n=1 Tax=Arcella intermedia TaxID=1963864 RepID=A0A6B2LL87_9EUKA
MTCVDGYSCLLDILDTAGYEDYSALRDKYTRISHGFLLIYSVTSRQSFEQVSAFRDQILRVRDKDHFPMILCGNKCDLKEREVSKEEGDSLAKSWGIPFYETSALANIEVVESFHGLVRELRPILLPSPERPAGRKGL